MNRFLARKGDYALLFSRPSHHCSCLKPKSSPKCRRPQRIIFFAHSGVRVRRPRHIEQPGRDGAPTFAPATPAEILAAAAYSPRRSSHANSLRCAISAKSSKVMAPIQMDFVPDGFRSSSPTTPARQSVSAARVSGPIEHHEQLTLVGMEPREPAGRG